MSTSSSRASRPPAASPDLYRHAFQTAAAGLALVDPQSLEIVIENARFFEFFDAGAEVDESLAGRIPGFDAGRAEARLAKGRAYTLEVQVGSGARARTVSVQVRPPAGDESRLLLVECTDVTKRKEAEHLLDSYARMSEKNTRDLQREKERVEKLLLNIMPRSVYEEMKDFGSVTPQRFDEATILMLDFIGFTSMAVSRDPGALVSELNDIFSAFDRIVDLFNCDRMKTIGDAYMAVAGLPEANTDHAQHMARVALRMRRYLERRNESRPEPWLCRVGIHSGPVVGSIVGIQKYVYDIFGPGVNMAARLESLADPMQILISHETYELVKEQFVCDDQGEVEVKGFGTQRIHSLEGEIGGPR